MHIALFGTSADPPTLGHRRILAWLTQHYDWVAVWASDNPFKAHQVDLEHRSTMLRLLLADLPLADLPNCPQNIALYPELSHPRSLITVQRARAHWPEAEFTLVIGSDLVEQIGQWYKAEELLQQVQLLVFPRPGFRLEDRQLKVLGDRGARIRVAPIMGLDVSSTAYRQRHHLGEATDLESCWSSDQLLSPSVQDYIQREKLYPCPDVLLEKTC